MAKAKGKRNRRKEKLEFVQDYLPIRDLKNGIIETTDNRYIKILEIEPINFTLRSDEEQFNIISSFASWLKISPMRLQFKSITRRADSDTVSQSGSSGFALKRGKPNTEHKNKTGFTAQTGGVELSAPPVA